MGTCHLRACRSFSTTALHQSYIGAAPITIPREVSLSELPSTASSHGPRSLTIAGPRGSLNLSLPKYLTLSTTRTPTGSTVQLSVQDPRIKAQRSMWGTTRALLSNSVVGVTEGFTVSIKFVGVGYRASVEGTGTGTGSSTISLRVGYSKPIVLPVPEGVSARCPQPTALIMEGRSKQVLTQFAADIRSRRPPEPYKGKGIFVDNETIKIKSAAGKK